MTDQNAPQTAKVDGQLSAADEIIDPIINDTDAGNCDDIDHDDQRWIKAVIANPDHHSRAARQALGQALLEDDTLSTTALSTPALTEPVERAASPIDAFPSPAPAMSETTGNSQKPSFRQSSNSNCYTKLLHKVAVDRGLTVRKPSKIEGAAHLTTFRWLRSSLG